MLSCSDTDKILTYLHNGQCCDETSNCSVEQRKQVSIHLNRGVTANKNEKSLSSFYTWQFCNTSTITGMLRISQQTDKHKTSLSSFYTWQFFNTSTITGMLRISQQTNKHKTSLSSFYIWQFCNTSTITGMLRISLIKFCCKCTAKTTI